MKFTLLGLLLFGQTILLQAQDIDATFFDRADNFLKQYVKVDQVNYVGIQQDKAFPKLLQEIAKASLEGESDATRQAFLINTYNLLVIKGVIDNYPLQSVLDVNGFFDIKKSNYYTKMASGFL